MLLMDREIVASALNTGRMTEISGEFKMGAIAICTLRS